MRDSFREIAQFMDSVEPADNLRSLLEMHQLESGNGFAEVWRRHNHTNRKEERFFYLNTFLMDIAIDDIIFNATEGTKPEVKARSNEIGIYTEANFDIVALCEVWMKREKDRLLSHWPSNTYNAHKITKTVRGGLVEKWASGSSGLLTISRNNAIQNPKFTEFIHEAGEDLNADKGCLKVDIDLGFGTSLLNLYSTHLQAGPPMVTLKQVVQIGKFVYETRNISNPGMLVGDFNLDYFSEQLYSTNQILQVNFDVPEIIRRSISEEVENNSPTGRRAYRKTAYEVVRDMFSVLGFFDLWRLRNGKPGYTSDLQKTGIAEAICSEDSKDSSLCNDQIDTDFTSYESKPVRIDYIFVAVPTGDVSFTVDFSRPRRPRTKRSIGASGLDKIGFLSDHLGLSTNLLIVPK